MSKRPRVSVAMASYNHANFVHQSVESALSQSFEDLELVVTDDGSSDGTADVLRSIRDPRFQLEIFPRNRGACDATNHTISRCRGEFVAILNSDDYFLPGKIGRQVEYLDKNPDVAAVFGLPRFVDPHGASVDPAQNPFRGVFTSSPANRFEWLTHFFLRGNALCHPTVLIRREAYEHVGLYDPVLRQLPDFDMWIRVCARFDIRVMEQELTAFRVLSDGQNTSAPSQSTTRRAWWEEFRVLRRFLEIDESVLLAAFRPLFRKDEIARGFSTHAMLGLLATRQEAPFRQAFGLATIEDLVRQGVGGLTANELHVIAGEANPFRCGWRQEEGSASAGRRKSRRLRSLLRRLFMQS